MLEDTGANHQEASESATERVQWLLEQWGVWARQGVLRNPTTPMARLVKPTPSDILGPCLMIDDDTAMAIDSAMCHCEMLYPKGHRALKLYYRHGYTNRVISKKMRLGETTVAKHKNNALAFLVGKLS